MEQRLKLYKYDNGELVSFPSKESPIEIGVFTYTAKRMGDAPTITATINYKECLDNLWTGKECVIFNDEFFYVKNIPTSSYSNTDSRYKHECTFVNERSKLNGVLFTDVVDDKASDGKPVSNSSKFYFNGNITEFVARLNASLRYAKLQTIDNGLVYGYHVVIDEGTKAIENFNDTFNVSFEDKTISEAIQEVYNSYNIPYYFEGKTVHVGLIDEEHDLLSDIDGGFKYGVNNELISISKSNKNNKIINRITALGSSENLPYYYPNETEKGSVTVTEYGNDTIPSYVELFNPFLFAKRIGNDDKIHYLKGDASWSTGVSIYEGDDSLDFKNVSFDESVKVKRELEDGSVQPVSNIKICFSIHIKDRKDYFTIKPYIAIDNSAFGGGYEYSFNKDLVVEAYLSNESGRIDLVAGDEKFNTVEIPVGTYQLWITYKVSHRYAKRTSVASFIDKDVKVKLEVFNSYEKFWFLNDSTTRYNLEDFGLRLIGGVSPYNGMAFAQKVTIPYYPVSQNLILPIYRSTQGEERFYNAYNATYKDENGNYYNFKNEYAEDSISEHIVKFDDIKPTIKGVEYNGRRIDKFVEFAYDKSDNDLKQVVEDKEEYQHPYFFAKLPPLGFNLFDHALETGEMTISMTSGHCAGCSFTIMVNDANKNTVQVDEDGNLKYDEGGYVLVGSVNGQGNQSPIDSQNDTTDNSVWIALKKDIDSFGTILPSSNIKPSNNDTFVITNILLPQEYIEAAEERLKNEAIKYMAENNSSKFSFSIKFSRIFLAENPTIFDKISENSRIAVNYNGSIYPLHVSSYSYKMSEGALLPEIDVSLTDSVVISTNAIESAVSEAKADVLTYVDRYATLEEATTIFIRKDKEDYSPSPMVYGRSLTVNESHKVGENLDVAKNATIGEKTTTKTIQVAEQASVGTYVEGVSGIVMKIDSDGSSYMELDRLKVRMKAYFDELEVQKVNTVGGKMIMSPAGSFTCGAVLTSEELIANGEDVDTTNGSFYRCFFNAVQDDEQIENKFIVGDFAFSQSFNLTGRSSNKMYWREVVGVSSTYVDLSYDKCALDSDIPSSGDIICQLGSKVKDRQNAIVMTTVDDYAPAITLHYGIDKFSLSGTEIIQYGVRNGKAFFNSYGDMFLGEKPVEGVSNAYMKYTTEGGLEIKGKLTVGTTYGDKTIGELINEAKPEDYEDFKAAVTKEFENIRNELDGVIDTWFGDDTPTLENYPASEWVTNTDKDSHLGDLYYTSDGKAYRFQYRDTEGYYWAAIEDSEVVKALELAQKALDTADGKRRVFIDTPYPPYDLGDLWAGGENQPLKRCINEKIEGLSFSEGDWALADDSHAYSDAIKRELEETISNTKNDLDKAVEDAEKAAKDYTDEGKNALQESIDALNAAKADIDNVYTKAEADSEITRAEAEAIAAAKNHANAAIELSEETTKAYADGIVTEEEEARIEQAKENLAEAKAYAEEKANEAFANAQKEIAGYEYLKEALKQDTTVEGGIIQTSTIRLGYQEGETRTTTAGVNGVVLPEKNGEDIAFWAGGDMIDAEKENSANAAKFVVRMDGSGYFSNKEITWTKEGELNFSGGITIGGEKEETLGSLLENITNLKKTINRWFQEENGVLKTPLPFASDSTVSSLGVGTDGTGGVSYDRLDSWNSYTDDKAGYVLSAALGWDLKTRLDNLDIGDFDLSGYLKVEDAQDIYATIASLTNLSTRVGVAEDNIDALGLRIQGVESNYVKKGGDTMTGQLTSSVANGTAPFVVASKTLVSNLNADLLDGKHLSDILASDITGNADTATRLKEPVTLWGKSFDGSSNISGNLTGVGNITGTAGISISTTGKNGILLRYNSNDATSIALYSTAFRPLDAANGVFDLGSTSARWKGIYGNTLDLTGSVSLGTANTSIGYMQGGHVVIRGTETGTVIAANGSSITFRPKGNTVVTGQMTLYPSGDLVVGHNGELTDNGYRLDVNGTFRASGSATIGGTLNVTGNATFRNRIYLSDNVYIYWDSSYNAIRTNASFASDGTMSSLGVGSDEGGGGSADWGAVPTNIIPAVDGGYNLGSASSHWSKLYVTRIENSDDDLYLNSGGYIRMLTDVVFGNNDNHYIAPTGIAYLGNIYSNGNIVATLDAVDSKLNGYYTKGESDNKYLYKGYDGATFEINSDFKIAYAINSLLKLENKVNNDVRIAFIGNGAILGYIGMNGSSPVFIDPNGGKHIIALKDDNVNLSNYYTKTETNSAISSAINKLDFATGDEVLDMLSNYITTGDLSSELSFYQPLIDSNNKIPYSLISGTPSLATVATSGSYNDLTNKPTLGTAASYGIGSVASGNTGLVTGGTVYSYVVGAITSYDSEVLVTKYAQKATTLAGYGITDALSKYGGAIGGTENHFPLTISSATEYTGISFVTSEGTAWLRYRGGSTWGITDAGWNNSYDLLHTGNISNYALPLSGGTLTGTDAWLFIINRTDGNPNIQFNHNGEYIGRYGFNKDTYIPYVTLIDGSQKEIIHSGNIGSYALTSSNYGTTLNSIYAPKAITDSLINFNVGLSEGYINTFKCDTINGYSPVHSGNIGSQSVSYATSARNADTLDGVHKSDIYGFQEALDLSTLMNSDGIAHFFYDYAKSSLVADQPRGDYVSDARGVLYFGNGYPLQISWRYNNAGDMFARSYYNGWTSWKQFAFTNSNVASATKLATARTIWGQSFDGTGNVDGAFYINGKGVIHDEVGQSHVIFGRTGGASYLRGSEVYLQYGTNRGFVLNSSGNVTIGSSDSAGTNYKLYVNGKSYVNGAAYFGGGPSIYKNNNETSLVIATKGVSTANYDRGTTLQVVSKGAVGVEWSTAIYSWGDSAYNVIGSGVGLSLGGYAKGNSDAPVGRGAGIAAVAEASWYNYTGLAFYVNHNASSTSDDFTEKMRLSCHGHLIPMHNTSQTLGTSDKRWHNVYSSSLNVSGAASVGSLTVNGATAATQDWVTNKGYATQTSVNNSLGSLSAEISAVDARIDALGTAASKNWSGASSTDTTNLVTIGWVESKLEGYATAASIPTKTSQLTNDSRFISGSIETTVIGGGAGLVTGGAVYSFVEGSLSGYAKKATTLSGYGITDALPKNNPSVTGTLTVAGNVLPSNNNDTYSLGSTNYRWSKLYANGVDCTGDISSTTNISAQGNVTAVNGGLSGKTLSVSGAASVGSLTVNGDVSIYGTESSGYGKKIRFVNDTGPYIQGFWDSVDRVVIVDAAVLSVRGSVSQSSDERLKNVLNGDFRLSLATMACAPLVIFDWNNRSNRKHNVGTIAQYWEGCLPEVVSKTKDGTLALAYGELGVAMGISLANILEDTNGRVATVEEEIKTLKEENKRLKERVAELEAA